MSGQPPPSPSPSLPRRSGRNKSPAPATGAAAAASGGNDDDLLKDTQSTNAKKARNTNASPPPSLPPSSPPSPSPLPSLPPSSPPPSLLPLQSPAKSLEDQELEADNPNLFGVHKPIVWTVITLEEGIKIREHELKESLAKNGIPPIWMNMAMLRRAIDLRGMPEHPMSMPERKAMLIVTLAPPCSGKGTVIKNVHRRLGIENENCILDADPDNMFYEVVAEMGGCMPPKTEDGWLYFAEAIEALGEKNVKDATQEEIVAAKLEAKRAFDRYETFIPLSDVTRVNIRPIAPLSCTSKAAKLTIQTKYENMLRVTRDYIFQKAMGKSLNIILNVTGSGSLKMIDEYIEKANQVGYPVVIVGIHSTVDNCKARAKDRNSKQHRHMSESLVEINNYEFQKKGAIFEWEQKSRENRYRFILLENTWTPGSPKGGEYVTLLCDRLGNGQFESQPAGSLLTTGVYGMKWVEKPAGHFNIEDKEDVKKAAGAAAEAAKEAAEAAKAKHAALKASREGGYSRKRRLHTNRPRKTMKKYARRVTRRRGHGRGRSLGRRSQRR